jgi:hypothetical protein
LAPLGPEEAPLPLDPRDLMESGVFGVGAAVVHDLLRRRQQRIQMKQYPLTRFRQ